MNKNYKRLDNSRISDVIKTLQEIKEKHGDITVYCNDSDYCLAPVKDYSLAVNDSDGVVYGVNLED